MYESDRIIGIQKTVSLADPQQRCRLRVCGSEYGTGKERVADPVETVRQPSGHGGGFFPLCQRTGKAGYRSGGDPLSLPDHPELCQEVWGRQYPSIYQSGTDSGKPAGSPGAAHRGDQYEPGKLCPLPFRGAVCLFQMVDGSGLTAGS